VEGRGSTKPGPTFSLVYATPLLQHQARLGLNRAAAIWRADTLVVVWSVCSISWEMYPRLTSESVRLEQEELYTRRVCVCMCRQHTSPRRGAAAPWRVTGAGRTGHPDSAPAARDGPQRGTQAARELGGKPRRTQKVQYPLHSR